MKIELMLMGKTDTAWIKEGAELYTNRLKYYTTLSIKEIPELKKVAGLNVSQIKEREGELILKNIKEGDYLILLDENGKLFSSEEFAHKIEKVTIRGMKCIVFVVGGAYGFSEEVYNRADEKISLSKMTFSHQMVRVIFLEQLYRAYTIIKGEPYHHK
ncbi:MAG: 23S rRNA (pseudouridine(1915)-N(3))-methyltransferase RlmH [Bacteroidales bacterium]|nr:23S rRNA (pseudouridine(1915)-N(3))-methyltransferase RlmH [Bacteroidales bacterium]